MTFLEDMISGFRARPSTSLALASIGCVVGLFASVGVRVWTEADQQSRELLASWPADRTTIHLPASVDQDEAGQMLQRLPQGSWWAWRVTGDRIRVAGALPPELTPAEGSPLQPDLIQAGYPVALADTSTPWDPGQIETREGVGFRIVGKAPLPYSASVLLPAGLHPHPPFTPESIEVRLPSQDIMPLLRDLPFYPELSIVDHQLKRSEARKGFRKLENRLTLLTAGAALLTALILRSLIRMELRERRFEFALRRSLGARPADIRQQIITEIFVTSGIPALCAILVVTPPSLTAGLLLALIVPGWFICCALPPALHAASLPPHEALKEG